MSKVEYIDEDAVKGSGWYGWVVFAATLMIVIGVFDVIEGFAALFKDETYFTNGRNGLVAFNYTTWGWIQIALGIVLVLVGLGLLRGATWARILGVVVVGLTMIAQFSFATAAPVWSAIVITMCLLIIYAVIVHGGEFAD
jgi:hypothetical protein